MNLNSLVLSRVGLSAVFMTYPACLAVLITQWDMTATQAGIVQGAFTVGFALSLLIASILSDRFGAKRVFHLASIMSAFAAVLFAVFARSFETAAFFLALVGLSQGGTYTPALMLVSANVAPARKSTAMGWVLAGLSGGFVVSIVVSSALLQAFGYEMAFRVTALITVMGAGLAFHSMRHARDSLAPPETEPAPYTPDMRRKARLLTLGYIGHSWELFGAWAWIPAFLAAAILSQSGMSAIELGLWTAATLHLSGFFASLMSGYIADWLGVRTTLIGFAAFGAVCSFVIGWMPGAPVAALLVVATIYGFATIGDSAVLSSAMTDAVPLDRLGRVLGIRSVLGMGGGAASPVVFGMAYDLSPDGMQWGVAFTTLAVGGSLAVICALLTAR
jgi:MFS family permease